jgi:rhodanese-related sulfurtransferase
MKLTHCLYLPLFAGLLLTVSALTTSCKGKGVEPSNTAIIDDELKKLDKEQFSSEMKKGGTVIIDVRMPQDFEQGHLEGAININFFDPEFKYKLLELDRNKSYMLYEKGESKAFRAMKYMEDNGFTNVRMLKGGYREWTTEHAAPQDTTK